MLHHEPCSQGRAAPSPCEHICFHGRFWTPLAQCWKGVTDGMISRLFLVADRTFCLCRPSKRQPPWQLDGCTWLQLPQSYLRPSSAMPWPALLPVCWCAAAPRKPRSHTLAGKLTSMRSAVHSGGARCLGAASRLSTPPP